MSGPGHGAWIAATASLIALIFLGLAWELVLAPVKPGGSWLVLKVVPPLKSLRDFERIWMPGLLFLSVYLTIRLSLAVQRSAALTRATAAVVAAVAAVLAAGRYTVHGELTVRGISQPVRLVVEGFGCAPDVLGNPRLALSATATVQRAVWGMTWNEPVRGGGVALAEEIDLELDVSLVPAGTVAAPVPP